MLELPDPLALEVKSPRGDGAVLSADDLAAVSPAGFAVVLVNDVARYGPRWAAVPARSLRGRAGATLHEALLVRLERDGGTALGFALTRSWSEWLLDERARRRLVEAGGRDAAAQVEHLRRVAPPRPSALDGLARENDLARALAALRADLDRAAATGCGAQIEGQLHQALVADALRQLGYRDVLSRAVGRPDITASDRARRAPGDTAPPEGRAGAVRGMAP